MNIKAILSCAIFCSLFSVNCAYADFQHAKTVKCKGKVYPQEALEKRHEGNVGVNVTINAKGKVTKSEVTESSGHPELDEAAVKIFSSCKYNPALQDGEPVEETKKLIYFWKLPN
jgi:protein TonB